MPNNPDIEYSYNRIVIIGNGYDLALGMKTSYKDFLLHYLKTCVLAAFEENYEDRFVQIQRIRYNNNDQMIKVIQDIESFEALQEYCSRRGNIPIEIKTSIFSYIIEKLNISNWVDIETLYFDLLSLYVSRSKKNSKLARDYEEVDTLNLDFDFLTSELKKYISIINNTLNVDPYNSPMFTLNDKLKEKQWGEFAFLTHLKPSETLEHPSNVLYLNFNYTNSFAKINHLTIGGGSQHIINIHGNIEVDSNPIIFGYGDDTHEYYKEIEVEDNDVLLKYVKSFHYPRTKNYHSLLNFMSDGNYEVFIVGHSCGLSDRTLLKTIFEDNKCLCVKIFHQEDKEEHFYKSIAISRHFDDKQDMRKKILPYDQFAIIPQQV